MTEKQQNEIKSANNQLIADQGYTFNQYLPILDDPKIRSLDEIKGRISVMNALINIAFEAPTHIIKDWIIEHKLTKYLSESEQLIMSKPNPHLSEFEINSMMWYLESLWALMWVVQIIENININKPVGDNMASLLPNLEEEENNDKILLVNSIRSELEIYTKLDYYYRLHWYCVDNRIRGIKVKVSEGVVYERRKALEWVFNSESDWDNVEMST